ncbi:hypothetical protein CSUI_002502 [Cystoisospora suis]|uniref:Uncharacterized protein n=1 Tax=Cystoisospora suis TaxID=483139 RepID=A0A2C6KTQ7_9APIC|nr:hypothetical protein CSUI_002502 [Cystoisospora suis]
MSDSDQSVVDKSQCIVQLIVYGEGGGVYTPQIHLVSLVVISRESFKKRKEKYFSTMTSLSLKMKKEMKCVCWCTSYSLSSWGVCGGIRCMYT